MVKIDTCAKFSKKNHLLNIACVINFNKNTWLGGFNYFVNFFKIIKSISKNKVKIIVITNSKYKKKDFLMFKADKIIVTNLFSNKSLILNIISKIFIYIFGKDFRKEFFLKENNIHVLTHSGYLGKKSDIINLPIIWDFQELYNKKNFSLKDRFLRKTNAKMCNIHATKTIIPGNHALKSFKKYICNKKTNALLLTQPVIVNNKNLLSKKNILKKYNIENKNYFFVPNQFWVHKNHLCLLKALLEIKKKTNLKILIVSSGLKYDWRYPEHYISIEKFIHKNNLETNFIALGIIPFQDVLSFTYNSIALINPSLSEGWGNSVEQSKSLGTKVILSNIPSHKEQCPKRSIFFNSRSYLFLSNILIREFRNFKDPNNKYYNNGQKEMHKNKLIFARKYLNEITKIKKLNVK